MSRGESNCVEYDHFEDLLNKLVSFAYVQTSISFYSVISSWLSRSFSLVALDLGTLSMGGLVRIVVALKAAKLRLQVVEDALRLHLHGT